MKAFISIKYHANQINRRLIETIAGACEHIGVETICVIRDLEKWGEMQSHPAELMQRTFAWIQASDIMIVEISEKGVGVGIEAGYAHAFGKPVWVIARQGADIPETLRGIAASVRTYEDFAELRQIISQISPLTQF